VGVAVQADDAQDDCNGRGALKEVQESLRHPPVLSWTHVDEIAVAPVWAGNDEQGSVILPQWRGSGAAIEEYEYAPPNGDCRAMRGTIRVDWDSTANTVTFTIKYRGLPQDPSVQRTEGVDWFANPYHVFPKDIDHGVYRTWIILAAPTHFITFYYDPVTLNVIGNQFDFPNGPPNNGNVIPVSLPSFTLSGSSALTPDANGDVFHQYTISYNSLTTESGTHSFARISYLPFNLCNTIPSNPALGQLRAYVGAWQPAGAGMDWKTVLHNNLAFDLQVEKAGDAPPGGDLPYIFGGVAVMGNNTGQQGGVPKGYRLSVQAAIQNVSPTIVPLPSNVTGLGCTPYLNDPHVTAPNFCALGQ
jgi:hypothetical protein